LLDIEDGEERQKDPDPRATSFKLTNSSSSSSSTMRIVIWNECGSKSQLVLTGCLTTWPPGVEIRGWSRIFRNSWMPENQKNAETHWHFLTLYTLLAEIKISECFATLEFCGTIKKIIPQ